jgi:hypothetical protein
MRRFVRAAVFRVSLAVFFLTVAIAVRAQFRCDELWCLYGRLNIGLITWRSYIGLDVRRLWRDVVPEDGIERGLRFDVSDPSPSNPRWYLPRFHHVIYTLGGPEYDVWDARIPYWLILLVSGIYPAVRIRALSLRRRRERLGLCLTCGYDLRESANRCPECGVEITAFSRARVENA